MYDTPLEAAVAFARRHAELSPADEQEGNEEVVADGEVVAEYDGVPLHLSASSPTGYMGVNRIGARFRARYHNVHIGTFDTAVKAAVAYAAYARTAPPAALGHAPLPSLPSLPSLPGMSRSPPSLPPGMSKEGPPKDGPPVRRAADDDESEISDFDDDSSDDGTMMGGGADAAEVNAEVAAAGALTWLLGAAAPKRQRTEETAAAALLSLEPGSGASLLCAEQLTPAAPRPAAEDATATEDHTPWTTSEVDALNDAVKEQWGSSTVRWAPVAAKVNEVSPVPGGRTEQGCRRRYHRQSREAATATRPLPSLDGGVDPESWGSTAGAELERKRRAAEQKREWRKRQRPSAAGATMLSAVDCSAEFAYDGALAAAANAAVAAAAAEGLTLHRNEKNVTGYLGVKLKERAMGNRFQAHVQSNARAICLGSFDTAEEAALAVARFYAGSDAATPARRPLPSTEVEVVSVELMEDVDDDDAPAFDLDAPTTEAAVAARAAALAAAADAAVAAAEAEGLHLDRTTANPTGYTGVKQTGVKGDRYQANGYKHGKNFSLGTFGVPEEAALAVARWRAKGCPSPFSQRPKAAAAVAAGDEGDAPADGASPPKRPLKMSDLADEGRAVARAERARRRGARGHDPRRAVQRGPRWLRGGDAGAGAADRQR